MNVTLKIILKFNNVSIFPVILKVSFSLTFLDINMIFAATRNMKSYYEKFAEYIGQPNSVGELKSNTDEMKRLIKTQYQSITRGYP